MTQFEMGSIASAVDETVKRVFGNERLQVAGKGRFLDAKLIDEERLRVSIASDSFTLDEKITLERELIKALAGFISGVPELQIYYKRLEKKQGKSTPPDLSKNSNNPFGLSITPKEIPGVSNIIFVSSGKGGVGKSTIATNLAAGLATSGMKVGFLDADVYGPSGTMMLGASGSLKVSEAGKLIPFESNGVKMVSFGFMTDENQPVIWRGPLVSKALEQFCYDVQWGNLDYLIVDLPPGTGDVQISLIQSLPNAKALVVTTPQDIALIDVKKAYTMFSKLKVPVLGVVENMAYFECRACGTKTHIYPSGSLSEFVSSVNQKIIAKIPLRPEIPASCDQGQPLMHGADSEITKPFEEIVNRVISAVPPTFGSQELFH